MTREDGAERSQPGVAGNSPAPAVRRLLPDRVYQSLHRQILAGEIRPDERLPSEHQLAAQFLVSRPVVREALQQLREENLIFSRRGAGSFVCPGVAPSAVRQPALGFAPVETIADIQRCYEFRLTIEPEQAYQAALRWNQPALASIESAVELMRDATLAHRHHDDADFSFHAAIAKATNNHYFLESKMALREHISIGMHAHGITLLAPPEGLSGVFQEHLAIVQALSQRDANRA
ncbi:MAG: GntR family transcriptional regulator, partial [Rhodopila sp.]|nr:GntR family transcriptional regulator [Rhodopila sp.]